MANRTERSRRMFLIPFLVGMILLTSCEDEDREPMPVIDIPEMDVGQEIGGPDFEGLIDDIRPVPSATRAPVEAARYWMTPLMINRESRDNTGTYDRTSVYAINISMSEPLRVAIQCYDVRGDVIPPWTQAREIPPSGAFLFFTPRATDDPESDNPTRFFSPNYHWCDLSGNVPFLAGGLREFADIDILEREHVRFFMAGDG